MRIVFDGFDQILRRRAPDVVKCKRVVDSDKENVSVRNYDKEMRKMIEYFTEQYEKRKLDEYKPLDLSEIKKRIKE